MYFIRIDYPPSVNSYWGHTRSGKTYLTHKAKGFKSLTEKWVALSRQEGSLPLKPIEEDVSIELKVFPPDRRIRDLDNILKASLDALTGAKVWLDDKQVAKLTVVRMEVSKEPRIEVQIECRA